MIPGCAWSGAMLMSMPLVVAASARSEEPPPVPTTLSPRPISQSVDRVVERLEEERADPCKKAVEEGRPCFPVTTTIYGPEFSVRDSLRAPVGTGGPTPDRPPTVDPMSPYRPGSKATVAPLLRFDPGCVAKSVLKSLKGKNDVYYLYRMRDTQGERVELSDRRLEAATFQGDLEFLGRFEGECDALAAFRHEELKRAPARPSRPRPSPSPSATPARR